MTTTLHTVICKLLLNVTLADYMTLPTIIILYFK